MAFTLIEPSGLTDSAPLACWPTGKRLLPVPVQAGPPTGLRPVARHVRQPCLQHSGARRDAALLPRRRGCLPVPLGGRRLARPRRPARRPGSGACSRVCRSRPPPLQSCATLGNAGASRLAPGWERRAAKWSGWRFARRIGSRGWITINRGIVWRLMARTRLGQSRPGCAAELLFTDSELSFLGAYARQFRLPGPDRPGPTVRLAAHLGERWGPPARSRTGPPTPLAPP